MAEEMYKSLSKLLVDYLTTMLDELGAVDDECLKDKLEFLKDVFENVSFR